jgi:hypothetical protein
VNLDDELELREVFFGEGDGKNYAVLCHPEDATYPISSVFQDASNDGSSPVEFKLLDCNHVLSSEKTVFQRFNLNEKTRPTIFVSGKVGPPKQVGSWSVKLRDLHPDAHKLLSAGSLETLKDRQHAGQGGKELVGTQGGKD